MYFVRRRRDFVRPRRHDRLTRWSLEISERLGSSARAIHCSVEDSRPKKTAMN